MPTMVGARVVRKEDPNLITGRGQYVDDVQLPGTAAMAYVRSPEAHATITSIDTSDAAAARAEAYAQGQLGKRTILSKDRAGFIVNALLIPYILSAIRMFESGFASKEDIDQGMVTGCAHPMGPLALADLIGLDTTMAVADSL